MPNFSVRPKIKIRIEPLKFLIVFKIQTSKEYLRVSKNRSLGFPKNIEFLIPLKFLIILITLEVLRGL